MNQKETIECGKIIAQGLKTLEVFEKTGNRAQFQAVLDQAETFRKKLKNKGCVTGQG